ncbi:hypothetical protein BN940_03886 [Castellaniella defragrans 65Phen]|uniref:Uncharacterized protein n=1 Tax=Castellaniella defragrans (strain DSM 12143 / CCUG 39792 / 65Phen) TaxID=1437824 RepID=W8X2L8_CASD6|nr:hypothetical protein BN940_03886 [Castellaniella defragrans 65Phen]
MHGESPCDHLIIQLEICTDNRPCAAGSRSLPYAVRCRVRREQGNR